MFPELNESYNEKIRKDIISYLRNEKIVKRYISDIEIDKWIAWLEKQGKKSTNIDIDKMVMEYSQTKDGDFGLPVNCMIRAYRKGINDTLCMAKKLDPDKVIEWLVANICEFDYYVKRFKQDFGL